VNGLVEKGGVELNTVLKQGAEEHPEFHSVACLAVFLEYVRCQTGQENSIFFPKDFFVLNRRKGDVLVDRDILYLYMNRQELVGPFHCVFETIDYWLNNVKKLEIISNGVE
jgi:hypothetical protein